MPKTDQVGTQLLSSVPQTASVNVVDVNPGDVDDTGSLAYRASRLNSKLARVWAGRTCVSDYVAEQAQQAGDALRNRLRGPEGASMMIAFPTGRGLNTEPHFFTIRDRHDGELTVGDIDFNAIERSSMPPTEMSHNLQAPGTAKSEDFMTVGRFRAYLDAGHPPIIHFNEFRAVAVSATEMKKGKWDLVVLGHIPAI
jgi:hypothetical protein